MLLDIWAGGQDATYLQFLHIFFEGWKAWLTSITKAIFLKVAAN